MTLIAISSLARSRGRDVSPHPTLAPSGVIAASKTLGLVDVNKATEQQLRRLPRIGPVLARRIVEHRERIGRFERIEQLEDVSGIGPALFEQIRPRVIVGADGNGLPDSADAR